MSDVHKCNNSWESRDNTWGTEIMELGAGL